MICLNATLITAHSTEDDVTQTWNKGFGLHPLLSLVDRGGPVWGTVGELMPKQGRSTTAAESVLRAADSAPIEETDA